MNINRIKQKAASGMLWSTVDRVIINFGQLGLSIILARILSPTDFGLVAMLFVFLAISEVFVNSGMGSALIQRKNPSAQDYSTVFVFNFLISCLLYVVLFVSAPNIARFYDTPQLIELTRVLGISIIINSLSISQRAYLHKKLDIKSLSIINIIALFISGVVSIVAAFNDLGVWSLVVQILLSSIIKAICFHLFSSMKVSLTFSRQSFESLFGFSSKLLLSGLYAQFLQQITSLTIGKFYFASQLGFYNQGKKLSDSSAGTLASIFNTVTFPILASLQDNTESMVLVYRKLIRMAAFVSLPLMVIISLLAEPIIKVLLGEKWLQTIPILQWLALANTIRPLSVINMNILNAIGRSDLFLKVDLAKFPVFFIVLVLTMPLGLESIAKGFVIISIISFLIETYVPGKLFNYGAFSQVKDISKIIISTIIMALPVYVFLKVDLNPIFQIIFGLSLSIIIFSIAAYILKIEQLTEAISLIKSRI